MQTGKLSKEKKVEEILLSQYDRYFRLAMSFVHNEADAGDIVQNGAYKAIRSSHLLKEQEFAATWVYRIMLNEIFRFCRQPKFAPIEEVLTGSSEDKYEDFDLKKALDALPKEDKTVVLLRYFEELKLEEISQILQENISTVKSRLYRSIKKLRLSLEE